MTSKPNKPIMLFDCKTSQNIIGQDKFLKAFENILNHGAYCQGPETKELDEKLAAYSGVKYCSTCGSGTDALTLALMAWGVKEGDAVFVSSFTFVASAEAPVLLGATPIFVDSDPDTYNMDPKDLQRAIDQVKKEGKLNLKAVIPVDIFGSPCNYDEIIKIAHENGMKVLADSINSMPDAPKELYQEFMEDITNEIERETKIINDLLSLVKMDKSAAGLNVSSVNINELLEQILKRLQPIADKQKVELVLESFRPVTAEVDEVKITLAITNLVENAIKYNRNDGEGWVHVSLNADHQYFYLKVEDSGIGIPEESLDHIYERFYRVDKSHSREIGGTGLGLAITRNSILMHRGAIKVHSVMGEGTTFDVRIPLNYIA